MSGQGDLPGTVDACSIKINTVTSTNQILHHKQFTSLVRLALIFSYIHTYELNIATHRAMIGYSFRKTVGYTLSDGSNAAGLLLCSSYFGIVFAS